VEAADGADEAVALHQIRQLQQVEAGPTEWTRKKACARQKEGGGSKQLVWAQACCV
jgi:hypothetical protein